MAKYSNRYKRRSSRDIRRSKNIPLIVGLSVGAIILIAVIVFLATLLGLKLKSEAEKNKDALNVEYLTPAVEIIEPAGDVREVNAYIYSFNKSASSYIDEGIVDLSVMLRDGSGKVLYNSELAKTVGWDKVDEKYSLYDEVKAIHDKGGYICSYMYIGSFEDEGSMTSIKRSYEAQLVIEAAKSGVDEILLLGINVTKDNCTDVLIFLSDIEKDSGNCRIGIELDYGDVVSNDKDHYIAQMMLQVCDFIALDVSSVPCRENAEKLELGEGEYKDIAVAIEEIHYYTSKMEVRLAFNKDEVELYRAIADCSYINRQMHE